MSTIIAPDPFPGRCKNHRSELVGGMFRSLRCLDYEATEHVCTFEKPVLVGARFDGNTYSIQSQTKPKPWVKPSRGES